MEQPRERAMDVGFIGLGNMGAAMARNLIKAGHRITVYNRSRGKAEELAKDGAVVAGSPAEAARTGIALTMLANDDALCAVTEGPDGILAGLPADGILVSMSTVSLAVTRRLASAATDAGKVFVAAPVFGRPDAAVAAKLFIPVAGPAAAVARIEPLLAAMGQKTVQFGEDPVHAAAVKISGNFMLQTAIEGLAEALALIRKHGVDPAQYLDFMTGSLFGAPLYKIYGSAIVEQRYEPAGFALPLALKDTKLALAAADEAGIPLPLADLIRDRFLIGLSRGWENLDMAALGKVAAENAGLKG
jgi:3-hydroxyisobutyrate dehydrogenase-like beta-hydroxyacid dehydrogenase